MSGPVAQFWLWMVLLAPQSPPPTNSPAPATSPPSTEQLAARAVAAWRGLGSHCLIADVTIVPGGGAARHYRMSVLHAPNSTVEIDLFECEPGGACETLLYTLRTWGVSGEGRVEVEECNLHAQQGACYVLEPYELPPGEWALRAVDGLPNCQFGPFIRSVAAPSVDPGLGLDSHGFPELLLSPLIREGRYGGRMTVEGRALHVVETVRGVTTHRMLFDADSGRLRVWERRQPRLVDEMVLHYADDGAAVAQGR